jgi:acetylornithine/succinyldiaminopimelate/putrescine aminotransferase
MGGWAVLSFGRNHPAIKKALADFLEADYPSIVAFDAPLLSGLLAAELKKRTGNRLDYVFFTNSGTEGIEAAIKFAKCSTGRPGFSTPARRFTDSQPDHCLSTAMKAFARDSDRCCPSAG